MPRCPRPIRAMPDARPAWHAWGMNETTARTRHTIPAPIDRARLALRRAEEREAWQALMAEGERLARYAWTPHYASVARRLYAAALLAWREARHALDLALVPMPAAPAPRLSERRPQGRRARWRPARRRAHE